MATTTYTWTFAAAQQLPTDQGGSTSLTYGYISTGGQGGSEPYAQWSQATKGTTQTENAYPSSITETWESWGVPPGAIVTQVQVTAWYKKVTSATKMSTNSFSALVVSTGATTVHSAGNLIAAVSLGTATDANWVSQSAGTARAVDSSFQASSTPVALRMNYTLTTTGSSGSANVAVGVDSITITITHSAPNGAQAFGNTASATATMPATTTGNTIIAAILLRDATTTVSSLTGSGATFRKLAHITIPNWVNSSVQIWAGTVVSSGTTLQANLSGNAIGLLLCKEFSGIDSAFRIDAWSWKGDSGSSITTERIKAATDNCTLIGVCFELGSGTAFSITPPSSPWTEYVQYTDSIGGTCVGDLVYTVETTATGYNPAFSISSPTTNFQLFIALQGSTTTSVYERQIAATSAYNTAGTSITAPSITPATNSALIAVACVGLNTLNALTVSDGTNTWSRAVSVPDATAISDLEVWYAAGVAASAVSIQASSSSARQSITIREFVGLATSNLLDIAGSGTSGTGTTLQSGLTGTTTGSSDLIFAAYLKGTADTNGDPTNSFGTAGCLGGGGSIPRQASSYAIVNAAGSYQSDVAISSSNNWIGVAVAFIITPGVVVLPPPPYEFLRARGTLFFAKYRAGVSKRPPFVLRQRNVVHTTRLIQPPAAKLGVLPSQIFRAKANLGFVAYRKNVSKRLPFGLLRRWITRLERMWSAPPIPQFPIKIVKRPKTWRAKPPSRNLIRNVNAFIRRAFTTPPVAGPPLIYSGSNANPQVVAFSTADNGQVGAPDFVTPKAIIAGPHTNLVNNNNTYGAPYWLSVDSSGNLWVTEAIPTTAPGGPPRIMKYPAGSSGDVAPTVTIGGSNTLLGSPSSAPFGNVFDAAGNMWAIGTVAQLVKFSAAQLLTGGNIVPVDQISGVNTGLVNAYDIAIGSDGKIYIADVDNAVGAEQVIRIFAAGASGNVAPIATITGTNTGFGNFVGSVTLDSKQNVYVADFYNNRICIFNAGHTGNIAPDATLTFAHLQNAHCIRLDANDNIYLGYFYDGLYASISYWPAGTTGTVTPTRTITDQTGVYLNPDGLFGFQIVWNAPASLPGFRYFQRARKFKQQLAVRGPRRYAVRQVTRTAQPPAAALGVKPSLAVKPKRWKPLKLRGPLRRYSMHLLRLIQPPEAKLGLQPSLIFRTKALLAAALYRKNVSARLRFKALIHKRITKFSSAPPPPPPNTGSFIIAKLPMQRPSMLSRLASKVQPSFMIRHRPRPLKTLRLFRARVVHRPVTHLAQPPASALGLWMRVIERQRRWRSIRLRGPLRIKFKRIFVQPPSFPPPMEVIHRPRRVARVKARAPLRQFTMRLLRLIQPPATSLALWLRIVHDVRRWKPAAVRAPLRNRLPRLFKLLQPPAFELGVWLRVIERQRRWRPKALRGPLRIRVKSALFSPPVQPGILPKMLRKRAQPSRTTPARLLRVHRRLISAIAPVAFLRKRSRPVQRAGRGRPVTALRRNLIRLIQPTATSLGLWMRVAKRQRAWKLRRPRAFQRPAPLNRLRGYIAPPPLCPPAIVVGTATTYGVATATSTPLDVVSGVQIGDILYAGILTQSGTTPSVSGWNQILQEPSAPPPTDFITIFRRTVDGTEGTSITVNFSGSTNSEGVMIAVRNAIVPEDATNFNSLFNSVGGTFTTNGVTTHTSNDLVLVFYFQDGSNATAWTTPDSTTNIVKQGFTPGAATFSLAVWQVDKATPGATGGFTSDGWTPTQLCNGAVVALSPSCASAVAITLKLLRKKLATMQRRAAYVRVARRRIFALFGQPSINPPPLKVVHRVQRWKPKAQRGPLRRFSLELLRLIQPPAAALGLWLRVVKDQKRWKPKSAARQLRIYRTRLLKLVQPPASALGIWMRVVHDTRRWRPKSLRGPLRVYRMELLRLVQPPATALGQWLRVIHDTRRWKPLRLRGPLRRYSMKLLRLIQPPAANLAPWMRIVKHPRRSVQRFPKAFVRRAPVLRVRAFIQPPAAVLGVWLKVLKRQRVWKALRLRGPLRVSYRKIIVGAPPSLETAQFLIKIVLKPRRWKQLRLRGPLRRFSMRLLRDVQPPSAQLPPPLRVIHDTRRWRPLRLRGPLRRYSMELLRLIQPPSAKLGVRLIKMRKRIAARRIQIAVRRRKIITAVQPAAIRFVRRARVTRLRQRIAAIRRRDIALFGQPSAAGFPVEMLRKRVKSHGATPARFRVRGRLTRLIQPPAAALGVWLRVVHDTRRWKPKALRGPLRRYSMELLRLVQPPSAVLAPWMRIVHHVQRWKPLRLRGPLRVFMLRDLVRIAQPSASALGIWLRVVHDVRRWRPKSLRGPLRVRFKRAFEIPPTSFPAPVALVHRPRRFTVRRLHGPLRRFSLELLRLIQPPSAKLPPPLRVIHHTRIWRRRVLRGPLRRYSMELLRLIQPPALKLGQWMRVIHDTRRWKPKPVRPPLRRYAMELLRLVQPPAFELGMWMRVVHDVRRWRPLRPARPLRVYMLRDLVRMAQPPVAKLGMWMRVVHDTRRWRPRFPKAFKRPSPVIRLRWVPPSAGQLGQWIRVMKRQRKFRQRFPKAFVRRAPVLRIRNYPQPSAAVLGLLPSQIFHAKTSARQALYRIRVSTRPPFKALRVYVMRLLRYIQSPESLLGMLPFLIFNRKRPTIPPTKPPVILRLRSFVRRLMHQLAPGLGKPTFILQLDSRAYTDIEGDSEAHTVMVQLNSRRNTEE